MQKILLFVSSNSDQTIILIKYLDKHLEKINKKFKIHLIKITNKNINFIKSNYHVTRVPSLFFNNKLTVGINNILKFLNYIINPIKRSNPEELVMKYQETLINSGRKGNSFEQEKIMDNNKRKNNIMRRMNSLVRKRKIMTPTGRKSRSIQQSFDTDDSFLTQSSTPLQSKKGNILNEDGMDILEDYYAQTVKNY